MKNYLFSIGIIFCITLCACKKNPVVTKVPLEPAFKAAFDFLPGTYWIYKDSLTGRIDSFFVTNNIDGYATTQGNNNVSEVGEYILIYITECNISSPLYKDDTVVWEFDLGGNVINAYYHESKIYTGEIEYTPMINYPFQNTLSANGTFCDYAGADTGTVISIYDSYQINGQTFTNVAEVNQKAYISGSANGWLGISYEYNDWFYICSNIGLIKMNLSHPVDSLYRVWELQSYEIRK